MGDQAGERWWMASDARWRFVSVGLVALLVLALIAVLADDDDQDRLAAASGRSTLPPPVTELQTWPTTTTVAPPTTEPELQRFVTESRQLLAALPSVTDNGPVPKYERESYDDGGWMDLDGDCHTTRHEVLERDSLRPVTFDESGCFVETGRWVDAWSSEELFTARDATIDHVVPLSHAHALGAWRWDSDTKHRFANDSSPFVLVVVSQSTNSAKGNSAPDEWMPPDASARCGYAGAWVRAKARWELPVTAPERRALEATFDDDCDDLAVVPAWASAG